MLSKIFKHILEEVSVYINIENGREKSTIVIRAIKVCAKNYLLHDGTCATVPQKILDKHPESTLVCLLCWDCTIRPGSGTKTMYQFISDRFMGLMMCLDVACFVRNFHTCHMRKPFEHSKPYWKLLFSGLLYTWSTDFTEPLLSTDKGGSF